MYKGRVKKNFAEKDECWETLKETKIYIGSEQGLIKYCKFLCVLTMCRSSDN